MVNNPENKDFELICLIVNFGVGSKVIKVAKHNGISGGTITLGKGTIRNRFLEFLELTDVRKEIVLMIAEKELAYKALEELNKEFELKKPNHGIAFTTSIMNFLGTRNYKYSEYKERRGVSSAMYKSIFVIVDKGKAEDVIDAAVEAGSKGGTIINARGSGIHETNTVFSMAIEPEKEIALIISESSLTESIVNSIRDHLKIDEPGNGIIFILDINEVYGLYNDK